MFASNRPERLDEEMLDQNKTFLSKNFGQSIANLKHPFEVKSVGVERDGAFSFQITVLVAIYGRPQKE